MSGLHGLTRGEIALDGQPIRGPHPDISMVFQDANLLPWRTIDANVRFPFEIKGEKPDQAWIDQLMHRVGLEGFGQRMPRELSGGMQQRVALVRALSFKPSVLYGRTSGRSTPSHARNEPPDRGDLPDTEPPSYW